MPGEDEERSLLARAAAGDRAAFAEIYRTHHRQVLQYFLYRVPEREDAEDLTQQAFLHAWRSLGVRRTESPFVPWLLTIAHNLLVTFYRRRRDTEPIEDADLDSDSSEDPALLSELRFDQARVRAALASLKPEQQQVLSMRYVLGISHRDIGRALGKSEVNVRVIQHRALAEIKRLLDREGDR